MLLFVGALHDLASIAHNGAWEDEVVFADAQPAAGARFVAAELARMGMAPRATSEAGASWALGADGRRRLWYFPGAGPGVAEAAAGAAAACVPRACWPLLARVTAVYMHGAGFAPSRAGLPRLERVYATRACAAHVPDALDQALVIVDEYAGDEVVFDPADATTSSSTSAASRSSSASRGCCLPGMEVDCWDGGGPGAQGASPPLGALQRGLAGMRLGG